MFPQTIRDTQRQLQRASSRFLEMRSGGRDGARTAPRSRDPNHELCETPPKIPYGSTRPSFGICRLLHGYSMMRTELTRPGHL